MSLLEGGDHIPETLFALAKDDRYVKQCDKLLQKILGDRFSSAGKGAAWLLYALLVVRRTHKTLGMDYCGLTVERGRRLWMVMALSAMTSMGIGFYARKQNSVDQEQQSEALRGQARRQIFEEQRRAMLQRANNPSFSTTTIATLTDPHPQDSIRTRRQFHLFWSKLQDLVKQTLQDLSTSTVSDQGPHALSYNVHSISVLAKWALRLSLVHFCLKGSFPFWSMLGIHVQKQREHQRYNLLASRPNLHRFVALLMIQQAAASCIRGGVQFVTRQWVQGRQRLEQNGDTTLLQQDTSGNTADRLLSSSTNLLCGICKLPRSHPAVPKGCGHVFCWSCLYQWTSSPQHQECPLCRASCRPRDILPLYDYRP
jgi:hypothetical protein